MTDQDQKDLAKSNPNPKYIFNDAYPELIDEWQSIEQRWDDIRTKCDKDLKFLCVISGMNDYDYQRDDEYM